MQPLVVWPLASPHTIGPQELCDDVWHRAGDASTDYNWYTKRLTLAAVYTSTEVTTTTSLLLLVIMLDIMTM